MIQPDKIVRTNRRTLSLSISKTGSLIVRAPKRLSLDYILKFIEQKERWIELKQKAIKDSMMVNYNLINYNAFMLLGKIYTKIEIPNTKKVEIVDNKIVFPPDIEREKCMVLAEKFYIKVGADVLKDRVQYFANIMKLNYESIKIIKSKSKWGSCDSKGNIKLNYKLIMLPHNVVDYVIIHELSHLIEMNHSKNFYRIVQSVMPSWKDQRVKLKELNFLLAMF